MIRNKIFSPKVLIALAVALVVLSISLFGCAPAETPGTSIGSYGSAPGGSGAVPEVVEGSPAVVTEWELPIVVSITGTDSGAGLAAAWGFDYGVKAINESGGIRGVPVRVTIKDAGSNEGTVRSEINAISSSALMLLAPSTEALFDAGESAISNAKIPAVGAATNAQSLKDCKPFAISCIADPNSASVSAVETWVRTEKLESVYMIYAPIYEERAKGAEVAFVASGKTIADKVMIAGDTFDAAGVADKAIASGADAFYIDMNGTDTLRIVAQLKHISGGDAGNIKILCGPAAADSALVESAVEGDLLGVDVWATFNPESNVEKRKAFDEAFAANVSDPQHYNIAVDYYQSVFMLRQAIEMTGLTGAPDELQSEREKLAAYLYDAGFVSTDHGDFMIDNGAKYQIAKVYKITEKGFSS